MSRISVATVGAMCLLAATSAMAQENEICEAPLIRDLALDSRLGALGDADDETIQLEAGAVDAQLLPEPQASLTGGVLLRRGNLLAGADSANFDPDTRTLHLLGGVRYEDPATEIVSEAAEFAYDSGEIRFTGAEFLLGDSGSRGGASTLQISQAGTLNLDDVQYTTCPPGSNDWAIEAGDIDIDTNEGVGSARNVKLRFQGIPILYAPYLSFPVGNTRKSGVLTPTIGSAGRSGNEISVPYYWNIRDNADATITTRWLSDRGLQLSSEFRYLSRRSDGIATFEYLNDDDVTNTGRRMVELNHRTRFDSGWRGLIDFQDVSDSQYFEDLGGSLSLASTTHVNRNLSFDYFGEHWTLYGQVQEYQTLDETILPDDEPYRRLPQIRIAALYPQQFLGLDLGLTGEVVNFDRDTGVTGWRLDVAPRVELPIERPGWFVKPSVILEHTQYELSDTQPGAVTDPSRTLPIASFDTGLILERTMKRSENLVQTIEPRVLYVHVPFRDQTDLPVFDTILPDLNLVQLYRQNRFLGVDRVADMDQISVGVTSRILNVNTGEELVTATIGQSRFLSDQRVTLPGIPLATQRSSDYIAEVSFLLYENLNFDVGHQWGSEGRGTTQSEARLQYRPERNKILNLAYRFRRDSLEQGDVSWSWPLSQRWNFVGRYNYSFREREPLEEFYGIEYESCCWGLRVVSRRYLSTRDGTRDNSFGLQLVLKGMTSVGTAADRLLERGILGYSADLN